MRVWAALAGAVIGLVVGYFVGVHIACDWLYPTSNLCGIYGVFLSGPIGLVAGAVLGWITAGRREAKSG